MTPEQAIKQLDKLNHNLQQQASQIVAEKAVAWYKLSFTKKSWEGNPWPAAKNPPQRGSLLLRSEKLMSTIRPIEVSFQRIRIRAGSPQVPYAQIHQKGGVINHPGGTPYFFDKKTNKTTWVSKKKAGNLPVTKPHKIEIPQRQYMGTGPLFAAYILQALRTIKLLK